MDEDYYPLFLITLSNILYPTKVGPPGAIVSNAAPTAKPQPNAAHPDPPCCGISLLIKVEELYQNFRGFETIGHLYKLLDEIGTYYSQI